MTVSLSQALDGAELVKFKNDLDSVFAAWHGGHTVNFYRKTGREGAQIEEFDIMSLYGEEGETPNREEVEEAIAERFDEYDNGL